MPETPIDLTVEPSDSLLGTVVPVIISTLAVYGAVSLTFDVRSTFRGYREARKSKKESAEQSPAK